MTDKTDMCGPAFPVPMTMDDKGNFHHSAEHPDNIGGMTLWDYYAAHAPINRRAAYNHAVNQRMWKHDPVDTDLMEPHMAKQAARFADAMLAERTKRTEGQS